MYKSKLHKAVIIISLLLAMTVIAGCGQEETFKPEQEQQGGFVKIAPGAYDSGDTAIVISKQEKQKKITFLNLKKKKNYTLNYDGITQFTDKYGSQITVGQLKEGEVVDVQFLKDEKLLSSLTVSSDVWTLNDVSKFELDLDNGIMKIMNEDYTLDETTVVFSDGEKAEFLDITSQDSLQIKGIDRKIYSITIETGHGYLRLENEDYFIGGWIEVGQKIIHKIEEDMLLTVPEGIYNVYVSHTGIEGIKEAVIKRNQETTLDLGDLKKEDLTKYGNLVITVEPSNALVYIDGQQVDISRIIKTTYGLHQIMAKADGYDTVIQYIRVNENSANVAIALDEEKERSTTVSENSVTTNKNDANTDNNSTEKKEENNDNTAEKKKENTDSNNTEKKEENTDNNTTEKKEGDSTADNSSSSTQKTDSVSQNSVSGNSASATGVTTGYKVTIESPNGAEVYVDGNYVGIIPVSFAKKAGSHEVTIRKTGYLTRTYTIDVDKEDKDISYSFSDLTPIE